MRYGGVGLCMALLGMLMYGPTAVAQAPPPLVIKALAEKKMAQIPAGPLFWRLDSFPTIAQARAAAGPLSLAAESAGKAWLFTLGPAGSLTAGGVKVAEIGPLPRVVASEYLLRVNEATGQPGSVTAVHSHPGSEAFYVLAGQQTVRTPEWVILIAAGQAEAGPGGGTPLQVSSSGATDLHALVMFLVDAGKPFSSPAAFR